MKHITLICTIMILLLGSFVQAEEKINLFDTPIDPDIYLIRPGDELLVTFINSQIKSLTLKIDPEGKIVNETIGVIALKNKTLSFAKTELTVILNQLYNVNEIEVSIQTPRHVTIAVFGSVWRPGNYTSLSSDRVSDIIKKAGGVTPTGSKRHIIFHSNEKQISVDLDKAKFLGDLNSDPYLYAGTTIEVPSKSSQTVHITGDINYPREIELSDGDDLSLLIKMAGKFKNLATLSDVSIIRGNKKITNREIQPSDIIMVKSTSQLELNIVKIFGAVTNEGLYDFNGSVTLSEIINQSGGYTESANKELTTVFRQPLVDSHGEKSNIRYPISIPSQLLESAPLVLEINDSIFVPWNVGFIKISGAVLNPGYFPYKKNINVLYYVNSAGGFLPTANEKEMKIFNPISKSTNFVTDGVVVPDGAEIIIQVKEELK